MLSWYLLRLGLKKDGQPCWICPTLALCFLSMSFIKELGLSKQTSKQTQTSKQNQQIKAN